MNKLLKAGEVWTVKSNINAIEKSLGYHIPDTMIDISVLKDHPLTTGEIITYCKNVENIRGREYRNRYNTTKDSKLEMIIGFLILGAGLLLYLLDSMFGIVLL